MTTPPFSEGAPLFEQRIDPEAYRLDDFRHVLARPELGKETANPQEVFALINSAVDLGRVSLLKGDTVAYQPYSQPRECK